MGSSHPDGILPPRARKHLWEQIPRAAILPAGDRGPRTGLIVESMGRGPRRERVTADRGPRNMCQNLDRGPAPDSQHHDDSS